MGIYRWMMGYEFTGDEVVVSGSRVKEDWVVEEVRRG